MSKKPGIQKRKQVRTCPVCGEKLPKGTTFSEHLELSYHKQEEVEQWLVHFAEKWLNRRKS